MEGHRVLRVTKTTFTLLLAVTFFVPCTASANLPNEALVCGEENPILSPSRLIRAWSLDLRGELPSPEETATVTEESLGTYLDAYLESPEFAEQVVRFHRSLLWNNIENHTLYAATTALSGSPGLTGIYYRRGRSAFVRGLAELGCLDTPATYNDDGTISVVTNPDGTIQEGWVEVEPYWNPGTLLKVCGLDALDTVISPVGVPCKSRDGWNDPACGCGPELRYCRPIGDQQRDPNRGFSTSMELSIKEVITENRPYLDIFRDKEMWVNGPIVHFLRYQTALGGGIRMEPSPIPEENLPDLEFSDVDTWVKIPTGDHHSGLLTNAAYLLRFQTGRARADRFYTNFLCQPFQPPEEGLPVTDPAEALNPDLQNRAGCEYCHGLLEPAASYWGRWTETGGGFLDALDGFVDYRADCYACAINGTVCGADCSNHYLTKPTSTQESDYVGWLKAYVFRDDVHHVHIEEGPELLLLKSTVSAKSPFPHCSAHQAIKWLLRRDPTDETEWIDALAQQFVVSNFDYKALVRSILLSDRYRRVR